MSDEKRPLTGAIATTILGSPATVDARVTQRVEDEITEVIDKVLRPYLLDTIPTLMRKLNHQGVFDKLVRMHLENLLKTTLEDYCAEVDEELKKKIDKKFRETILAEYDARIDQAARRLLDERLAKLRTEFGK